MADDVVYYWVPFKGTLYCADLVTRTYVGMSSMDVVGAAQRALDWAGIPHANWPKGEPSSMEEFGTEVRNANAIDWLMSQIERETQKIIGTSDQNWRMLTGIVTAGEGLTDAEKQQVLLMKSTPLQIVYSLDGPDIGAWYAIGAHLFWHLRDWEEVRIMRNSGLLARSAWGHTSSDIGAMRGMALRANEEQWVAPPPATYTVVAGDTLTNISAVTGKSVPDLVLWNQLASADVIEMGQVLRLGP